MLRCVTARYGIDYICVSAQLAEGAVVKDWQVQYDDIRSTSMKDVSDHRGVCGTFYL